jgi:putative flippase GtrA
MSSMTGRVIRYGIAGLIATAIYLFAVFVLVARARVAPVTAAVIATAIVIVTSYLINRAFVFDTNRAHHSAFARFLIASLFGIAANAALMYLATRVFAWPYLVGAALTVVVVPPMNFLVNQFWAFRPAD